MLRTHGNGCTGPVVTPDGAERRSGAQGSRAATVPAALDSGARPGWQAAKWRPAAAPLRRHRDPPPGSRYHGRMTMSLIVAVDTGGTFTDIAAFDMERGEVSYAKALTTYGDLVEGVMECVAEAKVDLSRAPARQARHDAWSSTPCSSAPAPGRRWSTTKGFRDTLELARGNRTNPFDIEFRRAPPLIPRALRFEIDERVHGRGEVLAEPDPEEVDRLAEIIAGLDVEAVAVSFLNAYRDDRNERAVAERLRARLPRIYVTAGTELTREWYEYERCCTAAANAVVGPRMAAYAAAAGNGASAKAGFESTLYMMGSNGGVLSVERTLREPIALIESGPVGGCIGAGAYGEALGIPNLIAFDMGGTTAKCAVIQGGAFGLSSPYFVGGYDTGFPIRGSVVDIVEVGAGGGSIAWVDAGGRLRIGPKSAGSDPGPVAFGRGGTEPTVTDANLVLGRIGAGVFLGGGLELDRDAASAAIRERVAGPIGMADRPVEATAEGMLAIAAVTMTGAIRQITVERGHDPRDFTLFAFGGSGPLYASSLARELEIGTVIVPPEPGNFSAIGMLLADARLDVARTMIRDLDDANLPEIREAFAEADRHGAGIVAAEVPGAEATLARSIEMRYRGQKHSFVMPLTEIGGAAALRAAFEAYYRDRFGHSDGIAPIEIVGIRVSAYARTEKPDLARLPRREDAAGAAPASRPVWFGAAGGWIETPVRRRASLPAGFAAEGPLIVEEYGATTVIGPGDTCRLGALGEIRIAIGD